MAKLQHSTLAILPLLLSLLLLTQTENGINNNYRESLIYIVIPYTGYISTYKLILKISDYTLHESIYGKDLGKHSIEIADKLV